MQFVKKTIWNFHTQILIQYFFVLSSYQVLRNFDYGVPIPFVG